MSPGPVGSHPALARAGGLDVHRARDRHPDGGVADALDAVAGWFHGRREGAAQRQAVIAANAELQERELVTLATVADALAGALRAVTAAG